MLRAHRIHRTVFVLLLALLLPLYGLADAPQARGGRPPEGGMFVMRSQMGRFNVDRTNLSAEQKSAYEQALSNYAAVEDQCLLELVAAGDIQQRDVDMFQSTRDMQGIIASLETDKWDQAQQQTFQNALAADPDARSAALEALVTSGLLTQTQADALKGMQTFQNRRRESESESDMPDTPRNEGENGFTRENRQGAPDGDEGNMRQNARNIDIWTRIMNMDQTESIQKALIEIQEAQQAFSQALDQADIQMPD